MKILFLILCLTVISCKEESKENYTLKVFFTDGSVDTLKLDHDYQIDEYGNLGKLGFGQYRTIARSVKYVKEIR